MLIYVNGCSHTHEGPVGETPPNNYIRKSWAARVMERFYRDYDHYLRYIPTEIKKFPSLINDAVCGTGNDRIFHKSLESLTKLINMGQIPDYVIIQWSGPNRREHCDIDGTPLFVNLYDNVEYFVKFEPMASLHTAHYMYALQEFLKKYKINYFFITYMGLDESVKESTVFNEIDFDKIVDFDTEENIVFHGVLNYILKNNLNRDEQGHPNEMGYKDIAQRVVGMINKSMGKNIL